MAVAPRSTIAQADDALNAAAAGRQRLSIESVSTGQANRALASAAVAASDQVQRSNARMRSGEAPLGLSFAKASAVVATTKQTKKAKTIILGT